MMLPVAFNFEYFFPAVIFQQRPLLAQTLELLVINIPRVIPESGTAENFYEFSRNVTICVAHLLWLLDKIHTKEGRFRVTENWLDEKQLPSCWTVCS